ncbi:unnamed protein product [Rotaria sp. Silwood2]|nr:unnamed protein product [Rotaria sp. Silwood2]
MRFSVDAVVYFRISNPIISVTNFANPRVSTQLLAATTLRNIFLEGSNPITNHPAMLHVIENPYLYDIFTSIFHGIHPVTFDYKWLRTMYHGGNTGCHMDRVYMNRGSSELLTCWIPLDNIALDMSVLAILEGSHRMDRSENDIYTKLQHTYADMDVERDKLQGTGWFTEDPMEFYHLNEACQSCDSHPVWKTTGDF